MDQGSLGKIGNKVDETGYHKQGLPGRAAPEEAQQGPASTSDTVNLTKRRAAARSTGRDAGLAAGGRQRPSWPKSRRPSRTATTRSTRRRYCRGDDPNGSLAG